MNTTEETFSKQFPIALVALGQHMAKHQLPAPLDIEVDQHTGIIRLVLVGFSTHEQWLNSVHVDEENNAYQLPPTGALEPYFRTTWDVRLPDTGIRLQLRGSRPLPLTAVSA